MQKIKVNLFINKKKSKKTIKNKGVKKMILQEGADIMETVIDPFLLFFYALACIVFALTSYKKPELRVFIVTLLLMTGGITMCIVGIEIMEAGLTFGASGVAVLSAIILRNKTKMQGAQKDG